MLEVLKLVSNSWPIAIMFIFSVFGLLAFYIIKWRKQSEKEDKAYRSSQALTVRD